MLCFMLLLLGMVQYVKAEELSGVIENKLERLDLGVVDNEAGTIEDMEEVTFQGLVKKIITGEFSFRPSKIFSFVMEHCFGEVKNQMSTVRKLILIMILSGILKNLNASFSGKSVGELGFYICYLVLIVLVMTEFYRQTAMVGMVVKKMTISFQAMLPIFFALAASSGGYTQTAVIGPTIAGGAGILSVVLTTVVLPIITLAASLEMINHITEKPMLGRFNDLLKGGIALGMKAAAFLFMTLLSLQKLGASSINHMLGKTTKAVVSAIPVVGDVMGGAVESAAALTGMLKNGTLAAAAIFLICMCAVPLIRLGVMVGIYKVTAAIAEPVCEPRLVKCIGGVGDFLVLLFGILFLMEVMFLFSAILLLAVF
jgi:stage III sporulation protein AE